MIAAEHTRTATFEGWPAVVFVGTLIERAAPVIFREMALAVASAPAGTAIEVVVVRGWFSKKLIVKVGKETFEQSGKALQYLKTAFKGAKNEDELARAFATQLNKAHAELHGATTRAAQSAAGGQRVAPKGAFEIAEQGGKHSGFLKNYLGESPEELRRGISSLRKQIAEHQDKIANPERYIPNFRTLDRRQQQALLTKKWPSDVARLQEQLEILESLLKQLGGN